MTVANRSRLRSLAGLALAAGFLVVSPATGTDLLPAYRIRRMSNASTMQHAPFAGLAGAPDCSPDLPGVPEILGDSFDPGNFDEIDVAGAGRFVAYASALSGGSLGLRTIIVLREGQAAETVSEATGDNTQPSIRFDRFGWRVAFRGSLALQGESGSDIYLHTFTRAGDGSSAARNLTNLDLTSDATAFDPSLAALTRTREIKSGVKVTERFARVAFVSNGDLDQGGFPPVDPGDGRNPDLVEQLFLWQERDRRFTQLTLNFDEDVRINRPSISGNGRLVAFESTGDLDPAAVNPLDPSQVGNPDGVRQIFLARVARGRGRIEQLTFGDQDSFAPRISPTGRQVLFCTRADLLVGGNPEGNYEIFRWRRVGRRSRRIAQLTQTVEGDSVLPRPTRNPRRFVFYSTARRPDGQTAFGGGVAQCTPSALLWTRGNVRHIHGNLDDENIALGEALKLPVVTGPPAVGASTLKVHFATNDDLLNPSGDDGTGDASLTEFHMARATRFPRR